MKRAARTGESQADIYPILLPDLAADRALLSTIARHAGIPFLDASDWVGGESGAVEGISSAAVIREIETTFAAQNVEVTAASDDRVYANISGTSAAALSPGMTNFLGVLTYLCDDRLRTNRMAILAYDEAALEFDHRRAILEFLNSICERVELTLTLVVLVGNGAMRLGDEYYFHPNRGLRYMMRTDGLSERHWDGTNQSNTNFLSNPDKPLVLFLGAGASHSSSNMPLGNQLRDLALAQLFPEVDTSSAIDPAEMLARHLHQWAIDNGRLLPPEQDMTQDQFIRRLTLERVIREQVFKPPGVPEILNRLAEMEAAALAAPSSGILALRQLLQLHTRLVVVTVNFDRLVETGDPPPHVEVLVADDEFARAPALIEERFAGSSDRTPILKLHGTIEAPNTIIANVEHTALGLSEVKSTALQALMGTSSSRVPWAYVGYSMRDPDIWSLIRNAEYARRTDEYWVMPFLDGSLDAIEEEREPVWKQDGRPQRLFQRSITLLADAFFEDLLDFAGRGSTPAV
jgi:hypothetical protein